MVGGCHSHCCVWSLLVIVGHVAVVESLVHERLAVAIGCGSRWSRLLLGVIGVGRGCFWSRLELELDSRIILNC
jgi:hypothetical protein